MSSTLLKWFVILRMWTLHYAMKLIMRHWQQKSSGPPKDLQAVFFGSKFGRWRPMAVKGVDLWKSFSLISYGDRSSQRVKRYDNFKKGCAWWEMRSSRWSDSTELGPREGSLIAVYIQPKLAKEEAVEFQYVVSLYLRFSAHSRESSGLNCVFIVIVNTVSSNSKTYSCFHLPFHM